MASGYAILMTLISAFLILMMPGCAPTDADLTTPQQDQYAPHNGALPEPSQQQNRQEGRQRPSPEQIQQMRDSGWGGGRRGPAGGMGNMTEEQRQAIKQAMRQASIDACEGKHEGDACNAKIQNREGNETLEHEGQCAMQQDLQLLCRMMRPDRLQEGIALGEI